MPWIEEGVFQADYSRIDDDLYHMDDRPVLRDPFTALIAVDSETGSLINLEPDEDAEMWRQIEKYVLKNLPEEEMEMRAISTVVLDRATGRFKSLTPDEEIAFRQKVRDYREATQ